MWSKRQAGQSLWLTGSRLWSDWNISPARRWIAVTFWPDIHVESWRRFLWRCNENPARPVIWRAPRSKSGALLIKTSHHKFLPQPCRHILKFKMRSLNKWCLSQSSVRVWGRLLVFSKVKATFMVNLRRNRSYHGKKSQVMTSLQYLTFIRGQWWTD